MYKWCVYTRCLCGITPKNISMFYKLIIFQVIQQVIQRRPSYHQSVSHITIPLIELINLSINMFLLSSYVLNVPCTVGSCASAGYTGCCNSGACNGIPSTCFCEIECVIFGDCCSDFFDLCESCATCIENNVSKIMYVACLP